jgi:hypothetical protein
MMASNSFGARSAPRIAAPLVMGGLIANLVIAHMLFGDKARVFLLKHSMGDFIKHVMSFPGAPLTHSRFQNYIDALQYNIDANVGLVSHFHNMPLTVLITLLIRPIFAIEDPVVVYLIASSVFFVLWGYVCHLYADADARPRALGLALLNYPLFLMFERGNLFAGITAICLLAMLCRRRLDWTAVLLLAVAANIRPNVLILALPLLAVDRESLMFVVRTTVVGAALALVCLAVDGMLYPAYTLPTVLAGLALYKKAVILGPLGVEFGSSLWGAVRHFVPATDANAGLCTVLGLFPLALAWFARDRLSYPAQCFLAIAAITLFTTVLGDYHLMIFVAPLLLVQRNDPAFWPIVLGSCWMLIPKNYTPAGVLSWQVYLNPAGLIVAVMLVMAAVGAKRSSAPLPA